MIQYPIARTADGAAVHIDDWQRGVDVTCFGCGEILIGRLPHDGIKPTAHFAHRSDTECAGETTLHKAAKAAIARSRSLQTLSWDCPHCKRVQHTTDLSTLTLHEERRPCEGVTSDVLGLDVDGNPCVAIEVVVTHDVEAQTLERYRAAGIYVFVLRASWGLVGDLARGLAQLTVDSRVGFVDTKDCPGCWQVACEKAEWERRLRAQRASAWWDAWTFAWKHVGDDVQRDLHEELEQRRRVRSREDAYWSSWAYLWPRIAKDHADTWWIHWRQLCRELGDHHSRPSRWYGAWKGLWSFIGTIHKVDEEKRGARLFEDKERTRSRGRVWWDAMIRLWPEIAQRESGVTAAWKPICRRCRQDLTRDHACP